MILGYFMENFDKMAVNYDVADRIERQYSL